MDWPGWRRRLTRYGSSSSGTMCAIKWKSGLRCLAGRWCLTVAFARCVAGLREAKATVLRKYRHTVQARDKLQRLDKAGAKEAIDELSEACHEFNTEIEAVEEQASNTAILQLQPRMPKLHCSVLGPDPA